MHSLENGNEYFHKPKNFNLIKVITANFREYCERTTIHGVRYVGEGRTFKRIAWLIICLALLLFCGSQIYEIVLKWSKCPLRFSLDEKYSRIEKIPLPAVTICPQTLPNRLKFNFTERFYDILGDEEVLSLYGEEELKLFDAVSKVCGKYLTKHCDKFNSHTESIPLYTGDETLDILDENGLSHFLKFVFCKGVIRTTKYWECNLRLTKILLKQGLCYSFNLEKKRKIFRSNVHYPLAEHPNLILPDCDPDRMYIKDQLFYCIEDNQTKPYSVKDRRERLHVRTRFYEDFFDPICNPSPVVFIHSPYEIPYDYLSMGYGIDFEEFQRTVFSITPIVIKTDKKLKEKFSYEDRGCFFPKERHLKFFARYSQNNCEMECLTNATLLHKNCTTFWMPRMKNIKPCHLSAFLTGYEFETFDVNSTACNCLPDCNSVEYRVRKLGSNTVFFDDHFYTKEDYDDNDTTIDTIVLKQKFDRKIYLSENSRELDLNVSIDEAVKASNLTPEFDIWKWKSHEIEVYYEDSKFLAMRRHQAYTFADFLSQIGGILGCFLGMSILSIVEIAYFCFVQMCKQPKKEEEEEEP